MNKKLVTKVDYSDSTIQVKLLNVEKNSLFVSQMFGVLSENGVNIDMISQVMLDDEMRIDFTCEESDQIALNKAIEEMKKAHPRMMVYQSKTVSKIIVEGEGMKDEIGVAAKIFNILGKNQIPLLQVTTSEISISYIIPREFRTLAVNEIKRIYQL